MYACMCACMYVCQVPPEKKSLPPKVPIPTQNSNLSKVPPI